jgi:cyclophilin family peptidyl-prolyl cis-trans isomerase
VSHCNSSVCALGGVCAIAFSVDSVTVQGHHTIKGTQVHKIQPQFAAFGGLLSGGRPEVSSSKQNNLQHVDPGLLSVHKDGSHFALSLGRALALDSNYKVIGRIGKGSEVLAKLNDVPCDLQESPEVPIFIRQCGTTNHLGLNETFSSAKSDACPHSASAAAAEDLKAASKGVMDALKQGLKRTNPQVTTNKSSKRRIAGDLSSDDGSESGSDSDHDGSASKRPTV